MFGAWGKATSHGQTVQLRALDWVTNMIFRMLMDPSENILWPLSTIQVAKNTETHGSILVLLAGLVSFQESMSINLQYQKSVYHIPTHLLERKAG